MTTVIAGTWRGDYAADDVLTDAGVDATNRRLREEMERRWPDVSWRVVEQGPASGEWDTLVHGNGYDLPTEEQSDAAEEIIGAIWQGEMPQGSWECHERCVGPDGDDRLCALPEGHGLPHRADPDWEPA
ncbi:MAG TPA: hypothetical protein VF288_10740 [Mycobacteriales bacterium]